MAIDFKGSNYPKNVIFYAVFFYLRYAVSYRDLEEIMAECGVKVDHATMNRSVGEIRDQETAEIAVRAALVRRMVLTTIHTNDSISAITRLIDLGVPAYLLAATLRGILSQRLVQRLCKDCSGKGGSVAKFYAILILA